MATLCFLFALLSLVSTSEAFLGSSPSISRPATRRYAVDVAAMETARTAFFIWFFGASGGAGIARSAFPRMYDNVRQIQSLKDQGPSKGGETIGISPLCGYPQDLKRADIESVVNKKQTVEQIVEKYPIEGNFLSAQGYLTYKAFEMANKGENPLTVRAIFDTFNTNSDVCPPDTAQEKLDLYRANPNAVAGELLKAKLTGYASIAALLFLLGLADYEALAIHLRQGYFPEWPGLDNLPGSLFDPETGLQAIPKYWISDPSSAT